MYDTITIPCVSERETRRPRGCHGDGSGGRGDGSRSCRRACHVECSVPFRPIVTKEEPCAFLPLLVTIKFLTGYPSWYPPFYTRTSPDGQRNFFSF